MRTARWASGRRRRDRPAQGDRPVRRARAPPVRRRSADGTGEAGARLDRRRPDPGRPWPELCRRGRPVVPRGEPMSDERWSRVPRRLHDALEAGEISAAGFLLRAFLIGKVNHRTGVYRATLADLHSATAWPWKREHLRRECQRLAPDFT